MHPSPSQLQANRSPNHAMTKIIMILGRTSLFNHALRHAALLLLLLCGWNAAMAGERGTKSEDVTRPAAQIYHNFCSVCHGDKGDGHSRARGSFAVPPRNYTTPESAIELSRERMIHSVTYGRPGTAMISWKTELTDKEIEGVVDYIRAKFMRLDKNAKAAAKPSDKLLASRGGMLYMQTCAMCHGESGKREIAGRMQPPPTDFTSPKAASQLTRKRMIASITNGRPGTLMKGFGNEYSKADIEAMADFIREAYMSSAKPKK